MPARDLFESFSESVISPEKLELLDYLLAEEGIAEEAIAEEGDVPSKPSTDVCEIPLSFAQQRLWFLDKMDSGSSVYNIPAAFELIGSLNIEALHRALNEIVRRHQALRTVFQSRDGHPFQVSRPYEVLPLPVSDLSEMQEQQWASEVQRRLMENAEQSFDLAEGPLFRASLLCFRPEQHVLLLCMHHIVSDGWSMIVLYKELEVLYQAFAENKSSPLPELPLQYGDFSIRQRQWLQGVVLEKQLDYWKRQLAGLPYGPILPADRPRPPIQTYRGAQHVLVIPSPLSRHLRALSRAENVTLFMLLLAGFKVLLYRHSGRDGIAVGVPVANRNRTETEYLIGFFVNTLVLYTTLSGNPRFRELLVRIRETAVGAFSHQDLPFETLVDELRPVRSLDHSPLFQIMFTMQDAPSESFRLVGLNVAPIRATERHPAKFDLTWSISERGGDLRISITYNVALFDAVTIVRLSERFQTLLESIVADPTQRIDSLAILSETERRQLLLEWNNTAGDYPSQAGVHQLFELQAERTSDRVALVFGRDRWSYRELNERANQLAHHLRKLGVGAEKLVGVCLNRSAEMVVSMLAILKAGGAYVPLDPAYPRERLSFMLEDSDVLHLITEHRLLENLPRRPFRIVCLDRGENSISTESNQNPSPLSAGENAAYVIYTSGSTGRPKGVVVTHQAVTRLVINTDYVQLKPTDTVAQVSNASFDAMTFEVWGTLLNGACLVGVPTDVVLSPKAFSAEIREQRISAIFLTTALFDQMAREAPSSLSTIEHLLFGGEAADPGCVNAILTQGAPRRLLNVYGPTEATTFSSFHVVEHVSQGEATIPIGRPIKNCQLYILDPHLQPVPQGAAGELYIGGDGLARGYINSPELTAERFVPNPFAPHPGSRLYKSGDLARYRSDGAIELLGRLDHQIKLRGFRIEPVEVEETLRQHPLVRQAIVLVHQRATGDKRLAAFVIPSDQPGPGPAELRRWVRAKLPPYMRPADFVFLAEFPLTANGKVDRTALLEALARVPAREDVSGPRDELESQLSKVWQRVLNRPLLVGIHDNFFEMGGHSLLAVQLIAETERVIGKSLSLAAVFEAPTIAETAVLLRQDGSPFQRLQLAPDKSQASERTSQSTWSPLVALQPHGSKAPFFWIHGETSDAFLSRYLDADQPVYGLSHQSEDGTAPRFTTVEEIAALYLGEMRTIQPTGPYFIGGYCFGGLVAWEIAQQLKRESAEVALLALLEPSLRTPRDEASLLTMTSRSSENQKSLHDEISSHLDKLRDLEPPQKWIYVWSRVKGKISAFLRIPRPLKDLTKAAICAASLGLGYRIPLSLRSFYILRVYARALRSYKAEVYPGSVQIFVSAGSGNLSSWSRLAAGSVKVFEIPADHTDIRKEHFVHAWAKELSDSLRKAQTRGSSK